MKEKIVDFFKDLVFVGGKEHSYYVNGEKIEKSVSDKLKVFYPKFNAKKKALEMEKQGIYTQKELLKDWKEKADVAIAKGNKAHLFGELYPFNRHLRPQSNYDIAIMKFYADLPDYVIPIIAEAKMYHKEEMYAGTADILLYNTMTGTYILGDYKTNKDIFKNFKGQKMYNPFESLLNCPYNQYQLQLSYYQILIEQIEDIKVSSRKLIWLRPNGSYELYDTKDYTTNLIEYENSRINTKDTISLQ